MIDFDEILDSLRFYRRIVFFVLGLIAFFLLLWLFQGYGGWHEVNTKIDVVKEAAKSAERHSEEILDWQKAKEANVKHETAEVIGAVSADALPDMLKGLLSDYRNGR